MRSNNHQNPGQPPQDKGDIFLELRRKVQGLELLSASTVHLLKSLGFTGRLTVVIQNGHVLKSGYEEQYLQRVRGMSAALAFLFTIVHLGFDYLRLHFK